MNFSKLGKPQLITAAQRWWLYSWKEASQGSTESFQGQIYLPQNRILENIDPNPSFPLASCMDTEEISNGIPSPTWGAKKILKFFDTFWIINGFLSAPQEKDPLPFALGETLQFPI